MAYYLDLFTPETWSAFRAHGSTVSGFRERQRKTADRIRPGDKLLCYVVRLSRWSGILEVTSAPYIDASPIFNDPDPFIVRFQVRPLAELNLERSIPILNSDVWSRLSLTKDVERGIMGWAHFANLRASLKHLSDEDGRFLEEIIISQTKAQKEFPFSAQDIQRLGQKTSIRTVSRAVIVDVPDEIEEIEEEATTELRESHRVQATIARIGCEMGFRVWVPKSDKAKITPLVRDDLHPLFLDALPLNYDGTTLKTIEQIDVIWMKGRSMSRAFEVEHTTAVYSGLLRMADLLALQPNMDIRLHIVAPGNKRDKVIREIKRPVFSLLDRGPLYESCSYLPYEALTEISEMKHLDHMSDSIIEEFEEFAQDE